MKKPRKPGGGRKPINMVFILVDNGHTIRTNRLREQNQNDIRSGLLVPEVVIVDANTRLSASRG